ncbi:MAG: hypothetical protein VR72_13425 [Clostridiaceae bacterium BRH_c20a]|nr:MAG: hypothetical protein VR72_13425 [Clostridiaceae bacterium BRH_c20a]
MKGIWWTLVSALCTATLITVSKVVLANTDSFAFGFVLMTGVASYLVVYLLYNFGYKKIFELIKENYLYLLVVGIFGFSINSLVYLGLQLSTSINAAVLARSDVLFTALLGYMFFGEKLSKIDWFAFGVLFIGIFMVLDMNFSEFRFNKGDFLLLLSVIFLSLNAVIIRYKLNSIPRSLIALANSGVCAILFFLTILFTNRFYFVVGIFSYKVLIIFAIILQGLIFVTYYKGLNLLPTWLVRSIYLIIPGVNLLLGMSLLNESISLMQIKGLTLIIIGVLIISYGQRNQKLCPKEDENKAKDTLII